MTVGVNVQANPQGAVSAVRQLSRSFDELRQHVRAAGGDLGRLSQDIRDELHAAQAAFDGFLRTRAGATFQRRLTTYGQGNRPLWAINRDLMAPTRDASRASYDQMVQLALGSMQAPRAPTPATEEVAQSRAAGILALPQGADRGGSVLSRVGRGSIAGGVAAGIGGLLGGGNAGGALGGMLGFMVGGPAGALVGGALGSMAGDATGQHGERMLALDPLLRALNESAARFQYLNETVMRAADGLGLTYTESQRLLDSFVRLTAATDPMNAAQGMRVGAGFARSFGLDPGQTVGQFGQIGFLQGGGVAQQKQLAVLVGETIAQSSMWAKADQMLSAFGDFAQRQVQDTLAMPQLDQFARMLISMNASGIAGFRGTGGMGVMMAVDQAIKSGGSGEPQQVALFEAIASAHRDGTSPFAQRRLMQGGMFMTGKQAGVGMGETSNIEAVMQFLRGNFAGDELINATANLLGVNDLQAQGFLDLKQGQFGHFSGLMRAANLDTLNFKPDAMRELLNLAERSGGEFTPGVIDEARRIAAAGREETEASRRQQAEADISNLKDVVGGKIWPAVNEMKDAVAFLAREAGFDPKEDSAASGPGFFESMRSVANGDFSASVARMMSPWAAAGVGAPLAGEVDIYVRDKDGGRERAGTAQLRTRVGPANPAGSIPP